MLRNFANRFIKPVFNAIEKNIRGIVTIRSMDDEEVGVQIHDFQYIEYLQKPDLDDWEMRRCFNEILVADAVPHPQLIIAGLKACRKLNDFACTFRFLKGCRNKCGVQIKHIWPYIIQEIQPTLDELGCVSHSLEQIYWDRLKLALESILDIRAIERPQSTGAGCCICN